MTIVLFTDGACKTHHVKSSLGNGGWAWWVSDDWYDSGYVPNTTNNRMELLAVMEGLMSIQERYPSERVLVVSDSAYVVNCFLDEWYVNWIKNDWRNSQKKDVKNRDYWESLIEVVQRHGNSVSFRHCRGHGRGGPEDAPYVLGNDKADKLAVKARQDYDK